MREGGLQHHVLAALLPVSGKPGQRSRAEWQDIRLRTRRRLISSCAWFGSSGVSWKKPLDTLEGCITDTSLYWYPAGKVPEQ